MPKSSATQLARLEQVDSWTPEMELLGFNFAKLTSAELKEHAMELQIDIPLFNGPKPKKGDYVFYIEHHYAVRRFQAGKLPEHYLLPTFNPGKQYSSTLRQILTQHGIRWVDAECKRSTFDLNLPELASFFADNVDEMRRDRGFVLPAAASGATDEVMGGLDNMGFGGGAAQNSAGGSSPPKDAPPTKHSSAKESPINPVFAFQPSAQRQVLNVVAAAKQTSATKSDGPKPAVNNPNSSAVGHSDPPGSHPAARAAPCPFTFGQSGFNTANSKAVAPTISSKPFAPKGSFDAVTSADSLGPAQPNTLHETAPVTAPNNGAPSIAKPQTADGDAPTRVFTPRKVLSLERVVKDAAVQAIVSLRCNDLSQVALILDQLHKDLFDELYNPPATDREIELASSRTLTPRRILKVEEKIQETCGAVIAHIRQSSVEQALAALYVLEQEIQDEL